MINFAKMNANQVALFITFIRLNDEGSATISPFRVEAVRNDTLSTSFSWLAIHLNLTTRFSCVHLEHPSQYFFVTVIYQLKIFPICVNLLF